MRKIIIALLLLTTGHSAFASFSFFKKKEEVDTQYTLAHENSKTLDERFNLLFMIASNRSYKNANVDLPSFGYVRNQYLTLSNQPIEGVDFKKSLIESCFYSNPNKLDESQCAYDMYSQKYLEIEDTARKNEEKIAIDAQNSKREKREKERIIHEKKYGVARTDANLEKYCKASAIVDTVAYTRAAGVSSIYDYQYEDAKKLVSLTPAQERAWKVHASENPDYALLVASDFRMQQNEFNSYRIKCFAEPHMILNFLNIFHIKPENYDEAVANWKHGNN